MTTIAIVAPGAMGSGVAQRLTEHGVEVLTLLDGRSEATRKRAVAAGMTGSSMVELMRAEIILSILPPANAMTFAQSLVPALAAANQKPVYVDCNALDVETVKAVGRCVTETGARFVDGGIIGLPPKPGTAGPKFYLAGEGAGMVAPMLVHGGLRSQTLDGPVGAASALKMSYAGITKGLTALASMMILGAERAGALDALRAELAESQPQLLDRFNKSLPDMVPKAYRWVAEMREIAGFLGEDPAGAAAFEAIAEFYERIAADASGERSEIAVIEAFAGRR